MSGRVCLFCGKPLSRIRVGGGEDFCSREHRNQHRLRRGMDQLQEANQMATLMRRRENPKPLATMVPAGGSASLHRSFAAQAAPRPRMEIAYWRPASLAPADRPKVSVPLETSRFTPLTPLQTASTERRRLDFKRPSASGKMAAGLLRRATPRPGGLERCTRQRGVLPSPSRGAALRVSLPVAIRRPRLVTRGIALEPQLAVAVSRTGGIRQVKAGNIPAAARSMLLNRTPFHGELQSPPPPQIQAAPGIRRPETISLLRHEGIECQARCLQAGWSHPDPVANLQVPTGPTGAMKPQSSKARVLAVANTPAGGDRLPRAASVPFLSQDVPFGFAEEEHQNR